MKKAFLLTNTILFIILFVCGGMASDMLEWDYALLGSRMYAEASKNTFSYNLSLLKGIDNETYSLAAGLYADVYDNIEITGIPDTSSSPSPVNVPFVTDKVNVFSLCVPLSVIFHRETFSMGLIERPSYIYLYSSHYFTNSIDLFASMRNDNFYVFAMLRNITKTIGINNSIDFYQSPELLLRCSMPVHVNEGFSYDAGIEIRAGRNDTRDFQMDYYLYGLSRSMFFDMRINNLLFGADLLGNSNAVYVGYDNDRYSIIISVKSGIVSAVKLTAGFWL